MYDKAADDGGEKTLRRAVGVLRAAEHLALAGLYTARHKHRQKVVEPAGEWLTELIAATDKRLERIEDEERGKGPDLYPVTVEMLRQAEEADYDPHLAYELAMAADALCFALENGL
jgi:enoyl-CoA hydratase/carnithine racemase